MNFIKLENPSPQNRDIPFNKAENFSTKHFQLKYCQHFMQWLMFDKNHFQDYTGENITQEYTCFACLAAGFPLHNTLLYPALALLSATAQPVFAPGFFFISIPY